MSRIFVDGKVVCRNLNCISYGKTYLGSFVKCPDCHRTLRRRSRGPRRRTDRLVVTNTGEVKKVSEMDSRGVETVEVRHRTHRYITPGVRIVDS